MFHAEVTLDLQLSRENRDENSIRDPKSILWAMRKSEGQSEKYLMSKLELYQKINWMRFVALGYKTDYLDVKERYRGYYVFSDMDEITERFNTGKALSCFTIDGDCDHIHVAYKVKKSPAELHYTSFHITSHGFVHETGVQFIGIGHTGCHQRCDKKSEIVISNYAVMLPYKKTGCPFRKQFTLVYDDWEVYRQDLPPPIQKGYTSVHWPLFQDLGSD